MEIHIGDTLFGLYRVEDGPFQGKHTSKIWKVFHTRLNKYMALREPREDYLADEESIKKYRNRYKKWFECGFSPYVISCFRTVEEDGVPFIISEWNNDDSLYTLIRDESLYSGTGESVKQRLTSYAFQMILALSHLVGCRVRDMEITPKNFVVSEDGIVRLTCFGNEGSDEDDYLSYYIFNDEQRGNTPAGAKHISEIVSELYSWALIVLEMYCGEKSSEQGNITPEKVPQILKDARVEMPEGLKEVVVQCLNSDTENKPVVNEIKDRLQEILKDLLEDDIAFCRVNAEFSSDLSVALNNEALRYDEMGKSSYAQSSFDEARERDPDNPLFAYNNCVCEWKMGLRDDLRVQRKFSSHKQLELTEEMDNEIRRCSKARIIIRQLIHIDDSEGYDETPACPEIDRVCFSKDSTKLMITSKQGNYIRICPAGKGDTLVDIPYNSELPDEYKDIFCEPITRYNGLYLTAEESDKEINYCELRAENSPRKIATLRCNYSAILVDYDHRFSFSPDGKLLAVPSVRNNGILIITCPENDIPRFKYAEFEHPRKLLEKKRRFNELKLVCVECMETKDYKKAVELVNEVSALGINRKECVYMMHLLAPVCKPTIYIPALRYMNYNGASQVAISYDGKYFAYRSNSSFGDDEDINIGYIGEKVSVPTSVGEYKNQKCFSEFDDIREFWFDGENNFCYTHTERVFDHAEDAKAYYSQIDFKNGIKKTDLLYTFSGDCVGNDSMDRLTYDNTRIKVVNPALYKETKCASEGSRVRIPMILQHYCRMCKFPVCAIDAKRTTMVAGDRSYIRVYDIEITLEYDEERGKEYQGTIVCDYNSAISDSIHLLDKVPIKTVDDSSLQTDAEDAVSESSDDKSMKENPEISIDYSKCDLYGIGDRNRFLLEMGGYTAFRSLSLLNEVQVTNPATRFRNWAGQAKEWVEKEPQKPHPDYNVQRLIAVSDEEYNKMLLDVARQSKFWHDKPELSILKVFLNTLKEGKDEVVHWPAEITDLSGFDEFNSFLVEDYPALASDFITLEKTQLVNPLPKFLGLINEAKEWTDLGNTLPHDDPDVQHLIECTDEEYESIVKETIRRSAFWHGLPSESFLSVFVRTQSKVELNRAEREIEEKYNDKIFYKIKHPSASKDRLQKIPNLIGSIRDLRTELLDRVIGQDHVVHSFCEAIFNAEVLKESDKERVRPLAAFTFAGPPGVGKTYLAEQAAKLLGRPYKRFDMTEYSTHDTHTGLIGFEYTWKDAAPGMLTSYVYNNPNAILLFDEIEKAHAQVIQIFYQILDAGIVTDKYYSTKSESATGSEDSEKRSRIQL